MGPPPKEIFEGQYVLDEQRGKIGGGAYGEVFMYRDRDTGEPVAVKRCRIAPSGEPGEVWAERMATCAIREASVLEELQQSGGHENIIGFKGTRIIEERSFLLLAFQYMEQSLGDFMTEFHTRAKYDPQVPKVVIFQILKAVHHLHKNTIMHRDLKPENVMIDKESLQPCLLDFGLSRGFSLPAKHYSPEVVTSCYRAPELLLGVRQYTSAVDIWSVGCIFAEMINGDVLFRPQNQEPQHWSIFRLMGIPEKLPQLLNFVGPVMPVFEPRPAVPISEVVPRLSGDPQGLDLVSQMLKYPPGERIMASDALRHPYFQDLPVAMLVGMP